MQEVDRFQEAVRKHGWAVDCPSGKYNWELDGYSWIDSSTKPWALGEPEIVFDFVVVGHDDYNGFRAQVSILPLKDPEERNGYKFKAGVIELSELFCKCGATLLPSMINEESLRNELETLSQERPMVEGYWNSDKGRLRITGPVKVAEF